MIVDVKDNFFQPYKFNKIKTLMCGKSFPWFFNDGVNALAEPHNFQFTHLLCIDDGINQTRESLMWENFRDIFMARMKIKKVYRIKANLTTKTVFHKGAGYHLDYNKNEHPGNLITSILYMNTNNGYTKFKKGGKVKSVANRMVTFDSNLEHDGYTCTNEERRIVVNFNYIPL